MSGKKASNKDQLENKIKIVLIEDEPDLLDLYEVALRKIGSIKTAINAEQAMEVLQESVVNNEGPDIILLDLIIPYSKFKTLDFKTRAGFEVLKKIKKNNLLKNIPVCIMTNLDSDEDRKLAEKLKADMYIVKSNVVPKEIIEYIKKILGKQ